MKEAGARGEDARFRLLGPADAEAWFHLRRASLLDAPLAFASSPEDDRAASVEAVRDQLGRGPESVIIGAFRQELVGSVGLYRDPHLKAAHKAHIWGMYVATDHRREGIAAGLLEAVLRHARTLHGVSWVHLSVSSAATEARRLYERAGFELWGSEPDALRHGGKTVVEHHMALELDRDRETPRHGPDGPAGGATGRRGGGAHRGRRFDVRTQG